MSALDGKPSPASRGRLRAVGPSIRARILLLAGAVLVPAAAVLSWRLAEELREAREEAFVAVALARDNAAAQVVEMLAEADRVLEHVATQAGIDYRDLHACSAALHSTPLLRPGFLRLDVSDSAGALWCSSSAAATRARGAPRTRLVADAPIVPAQTTTEIDPVAGELVVARAIRIQAVDGTSLRLRLVMSPQRFSDDLAQKASNGTVVTVVDSRLTTVMRTRHPSEFVKLRPERGADDPTRGQEQGFLEAAGRDGVERLYAFKSIPGTDWRVFAGLPRERVYARYEKAWRRTATLVVAALALAMVLAWRLASVIVRPVLLLQSAVRRVALGDLSGHVEGDHVPELQAVAHDFNQMIEALATTRSRLQALFDTMSEAVITTNAQQVIVLANPAAMRMLQCSRDELIGSNLDRWIPERYRPAHRMHFERFGASRSTPRAMGQRSELTSLRADGQEVPIEASISLAQVEGQPLFTAILRDVSERSRAMSELSASRAFLAAALANMSDSVVIVDAQGRVLQSNTAFEKFYRRPEGSSPVVLIRDLADQLEIRFAGGTIAATDDCPVLRALAGESGMGVQYWLRRLDGGEPWIGSFNFAPIRNDRATITGAVATARDITAEVMSRRALEQSRSTLGKLVAALDRSQDIERQRIARELHDEMQQTLAAIGMETSVARQLVAEPNKPLAAAIDRIESLSRAALLATRHIIADLRPQILEELGLGVALRSMADMHASRHEFHVDVQVDEPCGAADLPVPLGNCLYRVAQEALNNVAKHASATHVWINLANTGVGIRLQVRDDGRGLTPGAGSNSRTFGLLGMSERVRALGGRLRVHSEPGRGTLVEAELPWGRDSSAGPATTAS